MYTNFDPGYGSSPFLRFWRVVTRSFSMGTWFGVEVRMFWAALILMPLIFWRWVPSQGPLETLLMVAVCFVGLFAIIWTHEMGHIACGWLYRTRTDLITLGPLGGLAHMNAPARSPQQELWIALAGPAVHLVWLVVLWPIQWLTGITYFDSWYGFALWYLVVTNQALLVFNLLPIFPLDGGRTLRSLLAMKWHPNRATLWAANVGMIGGAVLVILALTRPGLESSIGFVIGLSCVMHSLQEKRMAKHALVYGEGSTLEPWQTDPDAWKRGGVAEDDGPAPASPLRKWREARAARKAEAAAARDAEDQREVDSILEKISRVGIGGLSAKEKAVLERASKKRRGAG